MIKWHPSLVLIASLIIWLPEGVLRGLGSAPESAWPGGVGLAVWLGGLGTCFGFPA